MWEPRTEEDGTVNVQPELTLPDASVVQVVGMPEAEPSYVIVRLCEEVKLEPVMVTDVPTAPDEGLRARAWLTVRSVLPALARLRESPE
jgi:hypothetical protein